MWWSPSGTLLNLIIVDVYSSVNGKYDMYTAAANGIIAPGLDLDLPQLSTVEEDVWIMTQDHLLENTQDGLTAYWP